MGNEDGPDLLYHYTDAAALQSILTSGQLWATDALYLNDASEFLYPFRILAEELEKIEPADKKSSGIAELLRLAMDTGVALVKDDIPFFVSCFCEDKDLLSQWRGYGAGIGGYSIGFKRRDLLVVSADRSLGPYGAERVDYDEGSLRDELRSNLRDAVHRYGETLDGADLETRLRAWQTLMGGYFSEIGFNALAHKSPGFAEEREWRIVVRARRRDALEANLLRFRPGAVGLIPYLELDVRGADGARPLIGEIVVGPTPHAELAERSLRLLLSSLGFGGDDVVVSHSQIPLRA